MTTRTKWLCWILAALGGMALVAAGVVTLAVREILTEPFRETELSKRIVRELLLSNRQSLSSIVTADEYCIIGVGVEPHSLLKSHYPTYTFSSEEIDDDPFFLRSDSHWHLMLLFAAGKKYQIVPVPINKIDLPEEYDEAIRCSAEFILTSSQRIIFNERVWILEATVP